MHFAGDTKMLFYFDRHPNDHFVESIFLILKCVLFSRLDHHSNFFCHSHY